MDSCTLCGKTINKTPHVTCAKCGRTVCGKCYERHEDACPSCGFGG